MNVQQMHVAFINVRQPANVERSWVLGGCVCVVCFSNRMSLHRRSRLCSRTGEEKKKLQKEHSLLLSAEQTLRIVTHFGER